MSTHRDASKTTIVAAASALLVGLSACIGERQTDTVQVGYRGVAMEQNYTRRDVKSAFAQVKIPDPLPPAGESPPEGPRQCLPAHQCRRQSRHESVGLPEQQGRQPVAAGVFAGHSVVVHNASIISSDE